MRAYIGIFLLAATAFAADSDYNGRWDITAIQQRPRAWWVELTGVGTPAAAGKFVSAYAGDMNKINEIAVENGELKFVIAPPTGAKFVYRAKLVGGKLEGAMVREGQSGDATKFTGVRAPELADQKDDR